MAQRCGSYDILNPEEFLGQKDSGITDNAVDDEEHCHWQEFAAVPEDQLITNTELLHFL